MMTRAAHLGPRSRIGGAFNRARACAGFIVLAILASACASGAGAGAAPMQISVIQGAVRITHDGKTSVTSNGSHPLATGDSVSVSKNGLAKMTLATGRAFELAGSTLASLKSQASVELDHGDILGTLTAPARVFSGGIEVAAKKGTFRVDRDSSSRIRDYEGSPVEVSSSGGTLAIPRYREVVIAGGVLPKTPRPLRLSSSDRWDKRMLQDVIDLDDRLSSFASGLEAQLGDDSGVDFYKRVLPLGVDVGFLGQFLSNRRSDVLIGLLMAMGGNGSQTGVQERFQKIFSLWSDGASWGLLAHEFAVAQPSLFDGLLAAIQKAGIKITSGAGGGFSRPRNTKASPSPTKKGSPGPSPSKGASPSPSVSPTGRLPGGLGDSAPTPVNDAVDQLFGIVP